MPPYGFQMVKPSNVCVVRLRIFQLFNDGYLLFMLSNFVYSKKSKKKFSYFFLIFNFIFINYCAYMHEQFTLFLPIRDYRKLPVYDSCIIFQHHCRACGNVVCRACSAKTFILEGISKKPVRVCDTVSF